MNYVSIGFQVGIGLGMAYLVILLLSSIINVLLTTYQAYKIKKIYKNLNKPKDMEFGNE